MILNECPSEHSSYGFHCSCIRERRSTQCCHCGHVFRKHERRNQDISHQMVSVGRHQYTHTGRGGPMAEQFCRYCEEPFRGDYSVGIPNHTEQDCRNLIDAQVAKGLELGDFPGISNEVLLASVKRVLAKRKP